MLRRNINVSAAVTDDMYNDLYKMTIVEDRTMSALVRKIVREELNHISAEETENNDG